MMKYLKYIFTIIFILGLVCVSNISFTNNYTKQFFNNQNKFKNTPINYQNNMPKSGVLNKKTKICFNTKKSDKTTYSFGTLKKGVQVNILDSSNDKYLISVSNIPFDIDNFSIDKGYLNRQFITGIIPKSNVKFKERKVVYLTFDDGPSYNTLKVLKVLKKYNIKATFFFNGSTTELGDKVLRKIVKDGHLLALHTFSHDYSKVYKNVDAFMKDLNKNRLNFYRATDYNAKIFRFPGGSNNTISHYYGGKKIMKKIIARTKQEGYEYVDWNAYCGDIEAGFLKSNEYLTIVNQVQKNNGESVVLIHVFDKYKSLPLGLKKVIKKLKKKGYEFDTVDKLSKPVKFKLP